MFSGGDIQDIGWPVRTLIKLECQTAKLGDLEGCSEAVLRIVDEEFRLRCEGAFPRGQALVKECQQQLGSTLWGDLREIKRKLNGKTAIAAVNNFDPYLSSLYEWIRYQVDRYQRERLPPSLTPATQNNPAPPATPPLWEQSLADLGFKFTHSEEWIEVATEIVLEKEKTKYRKKIEWSYWLKQNPDGTWTVSWTQEKKKTPEEKRTPPTEVDKKITFPLTNNLYPENLTLFVEGSWTGEVPEIQGVRLLLK